MARPGILVPIDGPRRKPRQARSRDTVEVLLEAAAQMFAREGTSATTNRIAERAGLSIGTLYQYFPDKNALLRAVAERHVADAARRLDVEFARLRTDAPPFDETIRALLAVIVDQHRTHPRLHAVMHRLLPRTPQDLEAMRELETHVAEEVAFHLKRCDRGGDDVDLTAQTIVVAVDAHVHRVMAERGFGNEASGATGSGTEASGATGSGNEASGATGSGKEQLVELVTALAGPPR